jgi:CubicO group peptidase (beta-lactamase class C family)
MVLQHLVAPAIEGLIESTGEATVAGFVDAAMVPQDDRAAAIERLTEVREQLRGFDHDISISQAEGGFRMVLAGPGGERALRVAVDERGISGIELEVATQRAIPEVTRGDLPALVDELEQQGLAGVVFLRLDGEVVMERAFGMANPALGIPNRLDTVFGTGSRPIDYTVAAILLLDQRGQLTLDDSIDRHFEDVPADKASMTIRHCLNGQSGLPDFFHDAGDRDADLAWVDRETAERRLLAQELLFAPGEGEAHSHGAFGLLAALIERVSGQSYYAFLRENFLDPAGMQRTGEYGETRGLAVSDFAAGSGPSIVGVPNIPPNWGPTSWLIKGSGGMYSTLGDLQRFYELVRSGRVLDDQHAAVFRGMTANIDGSDRGFELFSAFDGDDSEVYLFLNAAGDRSRFRELARGLEALVLRP